MGSYTRPLILLSLDSSLDVPHVCMYLLLRLLQSFRGSEGCSKLRDATLSLAWLSKLNEYTVANMDFNRRLRVRGQVCLSVIGGWSAEHGPTGSVG